VLANLAEIEATPAWFDAEDIDRLRPSMLACFERTADLLDRRRSEGFVRRCHGDLHLGNICLIDGRPTLFDAIEFSASLSWIDVLDDVAFLLMDLDHRRLRPLGNLFFNRYAMHTGDIDALAALPLFLADRAMVRAKVTVSTAEALSDAAAREPLRKRARAYLAAALGYLAPAPPRLVAIGGISGTGKTSLARRLAPDLGTAPGALHLRTDVLRKRLFGVAETERLPETAYDAATHDRVFEEMFAWARRALAAGHSVILDGVFGKPAHRQAAEDIAVDLNLPFTGFWLEAGGEVAAARVAARTGDASDATPDVVRRQLATDVGTVSWRRLDASQSLEHLAEAARTRLP
jgi:predicted kinase